MLNSTPLLHVAQPPQAALDFHNKDITPKTFMHEKVRRQAIGEKKKLLSKDKRG
jgi:hypothetical protein